MENYYDAMQVCQKKGHFINGSYYNRSDLDMVELSDPDIDALAYVSTRAMTEKVRVKQ